MIRVDVLGAVIFGLGLFWVSGLAAARSVRTLRRGADVPRSERWGALLTLSTALWLALLLPDFVLVATGLVPGIVSFLLMVLPVLVMGVCWVAGKWVRRQERIALDRAHQELRLPAARRMWQPTSVFGAWIGLSLAVSLVLFGTVIVRGALAANAARRNNEPSPPFDDTAMNRLLDGPVTTVVFVAIALGLAHATWQAFRLDRENTRLLNARRDVIGQRNDPAEEHGEPQS